MITMTKINFSDVLKKKLMQFVECFSQVPTDLTGLFAAALVCRHRKPRNQQDKLRAI